MISVHIIFLELQNGSHGEQIGACQGLSRGRNGRETDVAEENKRDPCSDEMMCIWTPSWWSQSPARGYNVGKPGRGSKGSQQHVNLQLSQNKNSKFNL